jgi:hypothetical protein
MQFDLKKSIFAPFGQIEFVSYTQLRAMVR